MQINLSVGTRVTLLNGEEKMITKVENDVYFLDHEETPYTVEDIKDFNQEDEMGYPERAEMEDFLLQAYQDYVSEVDEPPVVENFNDVDLNLEGFRRRFEEDIEKYESIVNTKAR